MPPTPLVPTYRVSFPYSCAGFPHVNHFFLDVVASADPSGFDAVCRPGFTNVGVSAVMTRWWNRIVNLYSAADAQFGNAHLDQLIAGAWNVLYTENNVVVPTSGSPTNKGVEYVWAGYSTLHERIRVVHQEPVKTVFKHFIALPSGDGDLDGVGISLFNYNATALHSDPYAWMRSRANDFTGSFTSLTGTSSKHWRRKRGLG